VPEQLEIGDAAALVASIRGALDLRAEGGADWVDRVDRPNATIVESTRHRADFIGVHHFDVGSEPLK